MSKKEKHPHPSQDTYLPPSRVHRDAPLEGERETSAQLKEELFLTGRVLWGQQAARVGLWSLSLWVCDHLKGLEGLQTFR